MSLNSDVITGVLCTASVVPALLATVKLTRPVPGAGVGPARLMPVYPGSVPVGPARLPTRLRLPIYSCEGLGPPTYKFRPATNYSEVDSVRFPAGDWHQGPGGGGDQLWGIKIDISTAEEQPGDHWEMIFLWIQSLWGIRGERGNTAARLSDNAELFTRPVNALTLCQLKCK